MNLRCRKGCGIALAIYKLDYRIDDPAYSMTYIAMDYNDAFFNERRSLREQKNAYTNQLGYLRLLSVLSLICRPLSKVPQCLNHFGV